LGGIFADSRSDDDRILHFDTTNGKWLHLIPLFLGCGLLRLSTGLVLWLM
jgi:hypothetical protein